MIGGLTTLGRIADSVLIHPTVSACQFCRQAGWSLWRVALTAGDDLARIEPLGAGAGTEIALVSCQSGTENIADRAWLAGEDGLQGDGVEKRPAGRLADRGIDAGPNGACGSHGIGRNGMGSWGV